MLNTYIYIGAAAAMVLFLYHDSLGEVGAQVSRETIAMTLTITMSQTMTITRINFILVCPGDNQCTWSCN